METGNKPEPGLLLFGLETKSFNRGGPGNELCLQVNFIFKCEMTK